MAVPWSVWVLVYRHLARLDLLSEHGSIESICLTARTFTDRLGITLSHHFSTAPKRTNFHKLYIYRFCMFLLTPILSLLAKSMIQ